MPHALIQWCTFYTRMPRPSSIACALIASRTTSWYKSVTSLVCIHIKHKRTEKKTNTPKLFGGFVAISCARATARESSVSLRHQNANIVYERPLPRPTFDASLSLFFNVILGTAKELRCTRGKKDQHPKPVEKLSQGKKVNNTFCPV